MRYIKVLFIWDEVGFIDNFEKDMYLSSLFAASLLPSES